MKRWLTEEQIIGTLRAAQQGAKRGMPAGRSRRSRGGTGSRSSRLIAGRRSKGGLRFLRRGV